MPRPDRTKPYNGATPDELRELGLDPDEVERHRLSHLEWDVGQKAKEDALLVEAARGAVSRGELMFGEAAEILEAGGHREAHSEFVNASKAEADAEAAAQDQADRAFLSPQEYAELHAAEIEQKAEAEKIKHGIELGANLARHLASVVPENDAMSVPIRHVLMQKLAEAEFEGKTIDDEAVFVSGAINSAVADATRVDQVIEEAEAAWSIRAKPSLANGWTQGDKATPTRNEFVQSYVDRKLGTLEERAKDARAEAEAASRPAIQTTESIAEIEAQTERIRSKPSFATGWTGRA